MYYKSPKKRLAPGDVCWTPLRRKIVLKRLREDGKWDACYQSENGGMTGDKVVLPPDLLRPTT